MFECHLNIEEALPLVCLCSLLSFLCGVGIGGNDLSANFAMVVGSGSLNMKQAILCCVVFELLGAAFMGGRVSATIRNGIVDPLLYQQSPDMVIGGMLCATFSAALWLYLSTVFGLPVSITHTVVGSVLGFGIFSMGTFQYIRVGGIELIALSWLAAPVLSAVATAALFGVLRSVVLRGPGGPEGGSQGQFRSAGGAPAAIARTSSSSSSSSSSCSTAVGKPSCGSRHSSTGDASDKAVNEEHDESVSTMTTVRNVRRRRLDRLRRLYLRFHDQVVFRQALWAMPFCMALSLLIDLGFVFLAQPPILTQGLLPRIMGSQPVMFVFGFVVIVAASLWAAWQVFPRTAEEARQQRAFCWEQEVVSTTTADVHRHHHHPPAAQRSHKGDPRHPQGSVSQEELAEQEEALPSAPVALLPPQAAGGAAPTTVTPTTTGALTVARHSSGLTRLTSAIAHHQSIPERTMDVVVQAKPTTAPSTTTAGRPPIAPLTTASAAAAAKEMSSSSRAPRVAAPGLLQADVEGAALTADNAVLQPITVQERTSQFVAEATASLPQRQQRPHTDTETAQLLPSSSSQRDSNVKQSASSSSSNRHRVANYGSTTTSKSNQHNSATATTAAKNDSLVSCGSYPNGTDNEEEEMRSEEAAILLALRQAHGLNDVALEDLLNDEADDDSAPEELDHDDEIGRSFTSSAAAQYSSRRWFSRCLPPIVYGGGKASSSPSAPAAARSSCLRKEGEELDGNVFENESGNNNNETEDCVLVPAFYPPAEYLFTGLQVLAGAMSSFVHGAVAGANATATFTVLYEAFSRHYLTKRVVNRHGEESYIAASADDPSSLLSSSWAMLPAMFGIAVGMASLGSRLMKTVGVDLVTVTPVRGWAIQVGATLVTMICTALGIPVSLSQCQVGAAIGCGVLDAGGWKHGVSWGLVGKIIGGWVVTLLIGSLTTGLTMRILAHYYCGMLFSSGRGSSSAAAGFGMNATAVADAPRLGQGL